MTNQPVLQMSKNLKRASRENDAPIWSRLAEIALKPSSTKRILNLNKINKITKDNDVVVVPGKLLGEGTISHKITLASFSISSTAAKKIIESGGQIINITELIEKFPSGKGVTIIG